MTKTQNGVYWAAVIGTFVLIMAMVGLAPGKSYAVDATDLKAGSMAATQTKVKATSTSSAQTANPYGDVTVKKVGKTAWESIGFVKAKGGYNGIVGDGKYKKVKINGKTYYKKVKTKFQPWKKVTRGEFLKVLGNLYGADKVPVTYNDLAKARSVVTGKYACQKMVEIAKRIGISITWSGKAIKLNRASVANYISTFAHYDRAFMPN